MTIPNWRDTSGDWFHHTPFIDSCAKLKNLTLNEQALVRQEVCCQMRTWRNSNTSAGTWTDEWYWGFTLTGYEPYDLIRMWIVSSSHHTFVADPTYHYKVRAYIVERSEYWPSASGTYLTPNRGNCGGPGPSNESCDTFDIDLKPPSGAWLNGSYEVQMQYYQPTIPGIHVQCLYHVGALGIMLREV